MIPGMQNEDSCPTPFLAWAASAPGEVPHIESNLAEKSSQEGFFLPWLSK